MVGCLLVSQIVTGSGAWIELGVLTLTGAACYIGALAVFDPHSLREMRSLLAGRRTRERTSPTPRQTIDVAAAGDG